ncbi:MAG: family 10 glycosylhydrolase [Candidatus Cloacimonas sp.]|jgi:uncharacterized lipoprotein YddW (UPF0748 family)|nr:family 10 glycosylhydrolase [Candidatus Cloacimonas sp.]
MRRCFLAIITLWLMLASGYAAEIRSVWALPWDISTPEAIDKLINTALQNNQNELLVEVRYRSDALFDTSLGAYQYPNPEPLSYVIKDGSFDPLTYTLNQAHRVGLKVQAWVIVFNATPVDTKLMQSNFIFQNHRDWITYDESGLRGYSSKQFGNFIDPGIPEVQDYLLDVFSNLAVGYPELDGIHLDYIRYPEPSKGYHPISLERYKEYCRNQMDIGFNEWRIMQVSGFVERLYHQLKQINPRLIISAAVFADIAEANVAYAQDWPAWLRSGIIDRVYPMAYNVKYETHKRQVEQMKLINHDENIIIGLRAWDEGGRSLATSGGCKYNVLDIARRIELSRELGFGGTALFSYAGLSVGNAWPQLKNLSYQDTITNQIGEEASEAHEAGAKISANSKAYIVDLQIPTEGRWHWEVSDGNQVYQRNRYYLQGNNRDFWDGTFPRTEEETKQINPGQYVMHLYRDDAQYKYLIPVVFEALDAH